jgi:hypothetical protein
MGQRAGHHAGTAALALFQINNDETFGIGIVFGIARSLPGKKTAAPSAPVPIRNCRLVILTDDSRLSLFIPFILLPSGFI